MNEWERELKEVIKQDFAIPHRYKLKPGPKTPVIFCETCGNDVSKEASVYLDEIVEDAMKHELANHH